MGTDYYSLFYFQRQNDEFALSPYEKMTMFNNKVYTIIYTAFYNFLFSSCPEFYAANAEKFKKEAQNNYTKVDYMSEKVIE